MADEIVYKGGELDSVRVISGAAVAGTVSSQYDAAYSQMGIGIQSNVLGEIFRSPATGLPTTIGGSDTLWCSCYYAASIASNSGAITTVEDVNGRPAFRINVASGPVFSFQHNTSATTTPAWSTLASFSGAAPAYLSFKAKLGSSKEFAFYIGGVLIELGTFSNSLIGDLSEFTIGSISNAAYISQIQFSRNVPLAHSRLYTRKASGAGTYQQMTGAYTNIVKTSLNDTTGLVSSTAGQTTTNQYQDITVPDGMDMHPDVWIWNRVRNDGGEPSSMMQACIVNSVMQKGDDMPVDIGFQGLPHVLRSMTPALWNACEVGQESTTP